MKNENHEGQKTKLPPALSAPAQRALSAAGIEHLEQVAEYGEAEIKQLHGIGPYTLKQLRTALDAAGLSYAEGKGK